MVSDFRYGHAAADSWQDAVQSCLAQLGRGRSNLGFLYVTDVLAPHVGEILSRLRQETDIAHWVGAAGIGICATGREYLDQPALAVMAGDFEDGSFNVFSDIENESQINDRLLQCGSAPANFAIVHADPRNPQVGKLVDVLAQHMESGFLVGGLTSSRHQNFQIADQIIEGGISGVSFSDGITIATRLTQGCAPLGPRRVITACQRNVIIALDERPALDVFREDIGKELAHDLNRVGGYIFAGLPISGSDTGDYLVRNLIGIDPANNLLAIGELVEPGDAIIFCRRDRDTARADMVRMLESIKQGLFSPPRGGVYYSCLGRGEGLFGENSKEIRMISEALGEFPLVGFFCNGEISHNRLYGYTGVLTLFL